MVQIRVPLGRAIEILDDCLPVGPDGVQALKARMRQFTDLGVPSVGRGKPQERLQYGLVELTEMSVVLLLTNVGITPLVAARHVQQSWRHIAPCAVRGIDSELPDSLRADAARRGGGIIAIIRGTLLEKLGDREVRGAANAGWRSEISTYDSDVRLSGSVAGIPSATSIDTSTFMPGIVCHLRTHAVVDEDLTDSIMALRMSEKRDLS